MIARVLSQSWRIHPALLRHITCPQLPDSGLSQRHVASNRRSRIHQTSGNLLKASAMQSICLSYLGQEQAQRLDEDLMSPQLGWSIEQLMELAGLSCACSIAEQYPAQYTNCSGGNANTTNRVIVLAGPGNNGGDGLVAARHLHHFGYNVSVCYPKRTDKPLYHGLVTQLESLKIPFVDVESVLSSNLHDSYNIVIDAMFGFSFKGTPRPPFDGLISSMAQSLSYMKEQTKNNGLFAVACVDIPSGWDVEHGDVSGLYPTHPDMLISLTAPKQCARSFKGKYHYLGGRFVPPEIVQKYSLNLPPYPGSSQCVNISPTTDIASIRKTYYVAKEEGDEDNDGNIPFKDPYEQFSSWFEDSKACPSIQEPNAMAIASGNADNQPSARMVLLRAFSPDMGFVFYSNYDSRKGKDFEANNKVCFTFFWEPLSRSVRVEGTIAKLDSATSDAYWNSRPREHQLGALASRYQSSTIQSTAQIQHRYKALEQQYQNEPNIPRPSWWGGYQIKPHTFEFWQGQKSRLHERIQYTSITNSNNNGQQQWSSQRLSP